MKTTYHVAAPEDFLPIISQLLETTLVVPVIALSGDLGVGKTAFVQMLARQLNVIEAVVSPTFIIMRRYETTHPTYRELLHIDLYRFEEAGEAAPLRLPELMAAPGVLTCVEWPEQAPEIIPAEAARLSLSIVEGDTREAILTLP